MASDEKTKKTKTFEVSQGAMILLVLLSVGGLVYVYSLSKGAVGNNGGQGSQYGDKVVESGDVVVINYVGRLLNGTVFDTSSDEVARKEGIYADNDSYGPISFAVNEGQMIPGIDDGVLGMKEGETKVLTITPESGFGEYNPMLIQVADRAYPIDRIANLSLETFRFVVSTEPEINTLINDPNVPWPMYVMNMTNDTITIRYMPEAGSPVETMFGIGDVVNMSADKIWIRENPEKGSSVVTVVGPAKVVDVNETSVVLDYNHPFAGQTLVYEVTVTGILKLNAA